MSQQKPVMILGEDTVSLRLSTSDFCTLLSWLRTGEPSSSEGQLYDAIVDELVVEFLSKNRRKSNDGAVSQSA